jgi:hypothetical protein
VSDRVTPEIVIARDAEDLARRAAALLAAWCAEDTTARRRPAPFAGAGQTACSGANRP